MPILTRSCLASLAPPFFITVLSAQFILNLLFYLMEFLDNLLLHRIGIENAFRLLLYYQPSFLVLALPIAFLFAILTVVGRLASDRELIALESCGFSGWLLAGPLIGAGVVGSLFMIFFMNQVLPWGNTSYLKLHYRILAERSAMVIKERVFIKDFPGYELYVENKDPGGLLKGIRVTLLDEQGRPRQVISASEGLIRREPGTYNVVLEMLDGWLQQTGWTKAESSSPDKLLNMKFETCALDLDFRRHKSDWLDTSGANNISAQKLRERIHQRRAKGEDPRDDEIGYQKKFSIPFATLAFALIGIPIGFKMRSGSVAGLVVAVILVFIYYIFLMVGEPLALSGYLTPAWAMWLPDFVLGIFGLALLIWVIRRPAHSVGRVWWRKA